MFLFHFRFRAVAAMEQKQPPHKQNFSVRQKSAKTLGFNQINRRFEVCCKSCEIAIATLQGTSKYQEMELLFCLFVCLYQPVINNRLQQSRRLAANHNIILAKTHFYYNVRSFLKIVLLLIYISQQNPVITTATGRYSRRSLYAIMYVFV